MHLTIRIFTSVNYTLKKSLGQHFLHDEMICKKIIDALCEYPFSNLLEIGPGGGALTKYLLTLKNINFKAVEIDAEKINYLKHTYPALIEKLIESDVLKMEIPFTEKFTIVGNFPYNISTQILFKILNWKEQVDCMIGMFQKEVAERVVSKEGTKVYGVTSVLIQAFFKTEYLFEVGENSFTPPPKVKSAVIRLIPKTEPIRMQTWSDFSLLVKTAFTQRRKMLRNSVKQLFDSDVLQEELFTLRPEQISIETFGELSFKMKTKNKLH